VGTREQGFNSLQELAGPSLVSSFSEYSGNRSLLTFLCLSCKSPFKTTPFLFKKSADGKRCTECKHRLKINNPSARNVFIGKCKEIHGEYYDYSLIPETFSAKDNITIICPKHGNIQTTADQHKNKSAGCQHCHIDKITTATRSSVTDFTIKANKIHEFKYRYDDVLYINATTPVTILCPKHGTFEQIPDVHLRGSGCTICNNTSRPVKEILNMLSNLNISYSTEKIFSDCVGMKGRVLRFDIFVPEKNLLIEYDGIHHFQPTKYSSSVTDDQADEYFRIQQLNDEIKDNYCKDNNINFIRIPHTEYHPDAIVMKYLTEQRDEREIYTWEDFNVDTKAIINYIKTFNYQKFAVYGISRGGLPFAVHVSNHFEDMVEFGVVGFQRYDGNDKTVSHQISHPTGDIPIFILDDLISSGITMSKVVKSLQHKYKKAKIHPIVIFGAENDGDVFFIREHPKSWIVFPYEI